MAEYTAHEITMSPWSKPRKMISVHCPSDGSGFKTRAMSVLEEFKPYYSHRLGWVVSPRKFARFEAAMAQLSSPIDGEL